MPAFSSIAAGVGAAGGLAGGIGSALSGGGVDYGDAISSLQNRYGYAADVLNDMLNKIQRTTDPWRQAGSEAAKYLASLYSVPGYEKVDPTSVLKSWPGYEWTLGQGTEALERGAAARGLLLSGPQQKALQEYGQNLALTKVWEPYTRGLTDISGKGLEAAKVLSQAALQTGTGIAGVSSAAAPQLARIQAAQETADAAAERGLWRDVLGGVGVGTGFLGGMKGSLKDYFGGGSKISVPSWSDVAVAGGQGGYNTWGDSGNYLYGLLARGGPVKALRPYIVGERGPELFVPDRAGYVVPNYALRSMGRF